MSDSTKKTYSSIAPHDGGIKGHVMFTWNVTDSHNLCWTQTSLHNKYRRNPDKGNMFHLVPVAIVLGMWVKLIACANFSATTRLVGYMCPARRCGTSMKLFSSVQYSDLINVYITFFLCSIYDKYERERQRGRELCSGLDYSLWSPLSILRNYNLTRITSFISGCALTCLTQAVVFLWKNVK